MSTPERSETRSTAVRGSTRYPRSDSLGKTKGLVAFSERRSSRCLEKIRHRQGMRPVVFGFPDDEGTVLEVDVGPGQARGLGTPQTGEQQKVQVIPGGLGAEFQGCPIPGGQLVRFDEAAAALDLVPGAIVAQPVHGVNEDDRVALGVLVFLAGVVEHGSQTRMALLARAWLFLPRVRWRNSTLSLVISVSGVSCQSAKAPSMERR